LTAAEFDRRYACAWDIKAELIDGVVYVASPVRIRRHAQPESMMGTWVGVYASKHPDLICGHNGSAYLEDDRVQPDVFLARDAAHGGQAVLGDDEEDDDYLHSAPEMAIEIAASSASYDLHDKKDVYARNGVQEYIVWQIYEQRIDWWRLRRGKYVSLKPDDRGVIHSEVFPGLRLNVTAMLAGDMAAALAELEA
jgi:Uma2 family endonuclease